MAISVTSWVTAGAIALALGLAGVQTVRLATEQAAHAKSKADMAEERVAAADENSRAQAEQRDEYERRILEKENAILEAQAKLALEAAARARADRAAVGLLNAAEAAAERARQTCKGAQPGPGSPPADDTPGVLAHVLGLIDQRAGILAEFAGKAHVAGQTCERLYNSLTP